MSNLAVRLGRPATAGPLRNRAPFGGYRQTHHPDLSPPARTRGEGWLHRRDRTSRPGQADSAIRLLGTAGASNSLRNPKRHSGSGSDPDAADPMGDPRIPRYPVRGPGSRAGRERDRRRKDGGARACRTLRTGGENPSPGFTATTEPKVPKRGPRFLTTGVRSYRGRAETHQRQSPMPAIQRFRVANRALRLFFGGARSNSISSCFSCV